MTAASRDWYLAALGIVQYRPRALMVAASGVDDTGVTAPATAEPRAPTAASDLMAVPPRLPRAGPTAPAQPATAAPATLSFRLACWRPVADLLVLDSMAPRQPVDPDRLQLLTNILRAIRRWPDTLPAAEFIDWPLGSTPGGRVDAATLLAMFLQGRCQQQPFRWVLAMGEVAALLLTDQQQPAPADWRQHRGQRMALAIGATAIFTPGLGDMVADPTTKAITWAALRFLADEPSSPAPP